MSNKKANRHVHKYYKVDVNYATVWACALPGCSHHMPPYYSKLLNGKYSICWECGEQMTLNPRNMEMEQPNCENCNLRAMGIDPDALENILTPKFGG